jgi:hypothetical protein
VKKYHALIRHKAMQTINHTCYCNSFSKNSEPSTKVDYMHKLEFRNFTPTIYSQKHLHMKDKMWAKIKV